MHPLGVIGNVNVDLILGPVAPWPKPGSEVIVDHDEFRSGGAAGNSALTWTALGHDHQIAANTGHDQFGAWLRKAFAPCSSAWPVAECGTTLSVGITHTDGERTFFTTRGHLAELDWPQVRDMLNWPQLSGGYLLLCGCFLMDALSSDYDALFSHMDKFGIKVALDTGWPLSGWTPATLEKARHWVSRSACLLLNEVEAAAMSGCEVPDEAAPILSAMASPEAIVVIKRGARGAIAQGDDGRLFRASAPKVKIVDTIGAGDVFNAAFLAALSGDRPLQTCLEHGVHTASTAISSHPRRYVSLPHPAKEFGI